MQFHCIGLCWDHPRVGGEKALLTECRHCAVGITPAWAGKKSYINAAMDSGVGSPPRGRGKSCCIIPRWTMQEDHPRVGGEKDRDEILKTDAFRITPAWAGKRQQS